MRYEITINIIDPSYVDKLVVALVRQGYDVYYNDDDKKVCFNTDESELTKLHGEDK